MGCGFTSGPRSWKQSGRVTSCCGGVLRVVSLSCAHLKPRPRKYGVQFTVYVYRKWYTPCVYKNSSRHNSFLHLNAGAHPTIRLIQNEGNPKSTRVLVNTNMILMSPSEKRQHILFRQPVEVVSRTDQGAYLDPYTS